MRNTSPFRLLCLLCLAAGTLAWAKDEGTPPLTLKPGYRLTAVEASPDGTLCATGNADGQVVIWNLETGAAVGSPREHGGEVTGVRFSPDGKWLASFSEEDEEARLQLWPLAGEGGATGAAGPALVHDFPINVARFNRAGDRILTASNDGEATIWDVPSGKVSAGPMEHAKSVYGAAWSPDESRVLTWTSDGVARQWDAATGTPFSAPMKHDDVIWDAVYAPDGSWAATASGDDTAKIWNASSAKVIHTLPHPDDISSVHVSPDGAWLMTECFDGALRFFDPATGKAAGEPIVAEDVIDQVILSADGKRLLLLAGDVQVWDLASRELVAAYPGGKHHFDGMAFHPDGQRIVIWWRNGLLQVVQP